MNKNTINLNIKFKPGENQKIISLNNLNYTKYFVKNIFATTYQSSYNIASNLNNNYFNLYLDNDPLNINFTNDYYDKNFYNSLPTPSMNHISSNGFQINNDTELFIEYYTVFDQNEFTLNQYLNNNLIKTYLPTIQNISKNIFRAKFVINSTSVSNEFRILIKSINDNTQIDVNTYNLNLRENSKSSFIVIEDGYYNGLKGLNFILDQIKNEFKSMNNDNDAIEFTLNTFNNKLSIKNLTNKLLTIEFSKTDNNNVNNSLFLGFDQNLIEIKSNQTIKSNYPVDLFSRGRFSLFKINLLNFSGLDLNDDKTLIIMPFSTDFGNRIQNTNINFIKALNQQGSLNTLLFNIVDNNNQLLIFDEEIFLSFQIDCYF